MSMTAFEIVPMKAQFRPAEAIELVIRMTDERVVPLSVAWKVMCLHVTLQEGIEIWQAGARQLRLKLPTLEDGAGAYGFAAVMTDREGRVYVAETAFDVARHWREAPRYGFLTDFSKDEVDGERDIEFLNRCHINVVQFYDWMYRHDRLVTEDEEFTDPLGRQIANQAVKSKIQSLRERGIASMAYAAVYASLPDYAAAHPEQVLYRSSREPYALGNYFYIMDISGDSGWTAHIIDEFGKVLEYGFDGFHLDQYGFPKKAIRRKGDREEVVALKELYPDFINRVRAALPEAGIIFNNVSDYPVHKTAAAKQDAMYTEVWDPASRLGDLKRIIDRARELSGKQMILAAYLPAFHPEKGGDLVEAEIGATIAMAAIFASGGYHLLLGEDEKVLADSYYPKYGSMSSAFRATVQRYYDFIVMYRNLIYDHLLEDITLAYTGGINQEITFVSEGVDFQPMAVLGSVWTIVKEKLGYTVLHLLNLVGLDNDVWHQGKKRPPRSIERIRINVEFLEDVEGVYLASPDAASNLPVALPYEWARQSEANGDFISFLLPRLDYWSMIYIVSKSGVPAACQ